MPYVSRFLDTAASILESAESAWRAGQQPSAMTIVVTADGSIQMLAGNDWPLDTLGVERGALMLFRVCPRRDGVVVVGRAGSQKCHLESEGAAAVARRLLPEQRRYLLAG